ncbi:MAG: archaemetzincin, partial [Paludibacter sp.]
NSLSTIRILPLGNVSQTTLFVVKNSLIKFYNLKVEVLPEKPLITDLLAKSKTRYEANKILSKFNSDDNLMIITEKDIAIKYKRRNSDEWGIFGIGYCPGKTCLVSTFRLKRHATEALFKERMEKVCIHEVGHNLGLNHCKFDPKCIMNDANGTISQVDREKLFFCSRCKKLISRK